MCKQSKKKKKVPCHSCITRECLNLWRKQLQRQSGTPIVMVSKANGSKKRQLILSITAGQTEEEALLYLQEAVRQLKKHIVKSNG